MKMMGLVVVVSVLKRRFWLFGQLVKMTVLAVVGNVVKRRG